MKKINKGLILTVIVVIALTIYLVNLEKKRENEKLNIQRACYKFVELTDKYVVLPQNTEKSIEEYSLEMKQELEKQMVSNKENIDFQHNYYTTKLKEGFNKEERRIGYKRDIAEIKKYEFEKNQVTVYFNCNVSETIKTEDGEQKNNYEIYGDEIILEKVDGEWKILYANLYNRTNMYGEYNTDSITLY